MYFYLCRLGRITVFPIPKQIGVSQLEDSYEYEKDFMP